MDQYRKQYAEIKFERGGLFELIADLYQPREVLYPGCSVHITPAFYFPHVVFVDQDPATQAFFSNHQAVFDLVARQRRYRRSPYIHFIAGDFTQPLPIRRGQFDLALGLFTGGVARACGAYLRTGGILVTNNHHEDALDAVRDPELVLSAVIGMHRGGYRVIEEQPDVGRIGDDAHSQSRRYLRRSTRGVEFIDNERYYVFKKTRTGR